MQAFELQNDIKPFQGNISSFEWHKNIIAELNNENYYDDLNYASHSLLKQCLKNPAYYQMIMAGWRDPSFDTESIRFGKKMHQALLEPDEFRKTTLPFDDTEIKIEASGKDWKEKGKKPTMTSVYKKWMQELKVKAERLNQEPMPIETFNKIQDMINALISVPVIKEYLDHSLKEQIVNYNYKGVRMKGMADITDGLTFIMDYKTINAKADLTPEALMENIVNYSYHSQLFSYAKGFDVKDMYILFQVTQEPYTPVLVRLSEGMIKQGRIKFDYLISNYKAHIKNGVLTRNPFYLDFTI